MCWMGGLFRKLRPVGAHIPCAVRGDRVVCRQSLPRWLWQTPPGGAREYSLRCRKPHESANFPAGPRVRENYRIVAVSALFVHQEPRWHQRRGEVVGVSTRRPESRSLPSSSLIPTPRCGFFRSFFQSTGAWGALNPSTASSAWREGGRAQPGTRRPDRQPNDETFRIPTPQALWPITIELPMALLPLAHAPMIEYTLVSPRKGPSLCLAREARCGFACGGT